MSLKAWYPFNGDFVNQGVGDLSLTQVTAPTYIDNGKIGKALNQGAFNWSAAQTASVLNNQEISICFWIYVNTATGDTTNRGMIFGGDKGSVANRRFSLFQYPTANDFHWSWSNGASSTFTAGIVEGVFPSYTWTHCCITYKNPNGAIYINGELKHSFTGTSNVASFAAETQVILNVPSRYLNDYRIYDHCLSPKEVKEISKGLCLHYTLNNNGYGQENLVTDSETFSGWTITDGWIKAQDTDGTTYIKFSRTGATANNWVRAIPTVKLTPSDYPNGITVSFDFKVTDLSALNHKCIVALQTYNANGTRVGWVEPNNTSFTNYDRIVNGQWVRIARHFTQTELLRVSQTGYTTADISYTMISFQLVQNGEIFIRKVKAEIGNTMTSWSPNSADAFYNSTEFDTSGYRNNATPVDTTIKHLVGSPRYTTYTKFNGNTSGLKIENTAQISPVLNNGIFTISFWVKHDIASNREIYFGNFDANADFNIERTGGNDLRFYWNASPDLTMSGATISDANWHHVVVVRNGSSIKAYVDGVLKYNGTATIASLAFDGSFRIGRDTRTGSTAFGGGMSDFRLYATALSDSDILELYNAPAAIDNMGNAFAMQLVEVI